MRLEKTLSFEEAGMGSSLFRAYYTGSDTTRKFWPHSPTSPNWRAIIDAKKGYSSTNRTALIQALTAQYGALLSDNTKKLLKKLANPNCFTVCTGHQLSFAGGPAYFFYKMISAIQLAQSLESQFPDIQVQPVYWMNSEDHDFAEINHFHFLGKTFSLSTETPDIPTGEQSASSAAVAFEQLRNTFPNLKDYEEALQVIENAYASAKTLSEATRILVQTWMEPLGILVLDQADENLKSLFFPTIIKDFKENISFKAVQKSIAALENEGFDPQVNPREINFFYHHPTAGRKRWIATDAGFQVIDTDIAVPVDQIESFLRSNLKHMSTNVVTRPLYQETILPNLAYLGGPAEVHYWLQYGELFQQMNVPHPAVLMRDSFLIIPDKTWSKWKGMGLDVNDLFLRPEALEKRYLELNEEADLDATPFHRRHEELYNDLAALAATYDPSLNAWTRAEGTRAAKSLDTVFGRLKKAAREKHQRNLKFISDTQTKLFPEGSFQERYWNVLHLSPNLPNFFVELTNHANPLNPGVKIITSE